MPSPQRSWRHSWLLPFALLSVPPLLWFMFGLIQGYVPAGDYAYIAIRAHDVFSSNPPLLGMPSTAGYEVAGVEAFHPGPIQFFLMAPIYGITGWQPWGLLTAAMALNLGVVAVGLWAAWRIDSVWVKRSTVTAMAVVVLIVQSWMPTPWNPWPVLLGGVSLTVVAWAIAVGCRGCWPWFALLFAIVAQGHIVGAAMALTVAGALAWVIRRVGGARKPSRRELVVSSFVLVACWAAPVFEAVTEWPGNPGQWWSYVSADRAASENPSTVAWLLLVLILAVAAVVGGRKGWRAIPRVRATAESPDVMIVATGRLLLAAILVGCAVVAIVGGATRLTYLGLMLGPLALMLTCIRPRSRPWWSSPVGSLAYLAVALAVSVVAFPMFNGLVHEPAAEAVPVVAEARSLVDRQPAMPVIVADQGPLPWAHFAPAVRAAFVAEGREVFFDYGWRPVDYDQQRRTLSAPRPHLVLLLVQDENGEWPDVVEGETLDMSELPLAEGQGRLRLVLSRVD